MSLPDTVQIRALRESDLDAVLAIEAASFPQPWKREHFLQELAALHGFPLAATLDGELVGYCCLMSLFEEAQILDIAVNPALRGRGIARALMEAAIALARDKGAHVLALEVRANNTAAIALYERYGFRRVGLRARYYEGVDDALLMELHLQGDTSCSSQP